MPKVSPDTTAQGASQFTRTHWSVVLLAAQTPSPEAQAALEKLCETYWYPLYAYLRRQGSAPADAQDLTQEFFARFLEKNFLAKVHPTKGKFRSFLLAALKHFTANEWDRVKAEKRGGKHTFISLDEQSAEDRYAFEPVAELGAEGVYEQRWALTVLDQALLRLREDYAAAAKSAQFEELKQFLSSEAAPGVYAGLGSRLQMAPGAVAVAVHRLRQRYGECLRAEIAETLSDPEDVDDEMRHLFSIINH